MDTIAVRDDPTLEDIAFLEDRIYDFNVAATGFSDGRYLACFLRNDKGVMYAGICGHTWGGTCEIKLLWMDEAYRRRGLGSRLLRAAEEEARRRGCTQMLLSTHSFQAPLFYRSHGFRELVRIDDYPRGHASIILMKSLT